MQAQTSTTESDLHRHGSEPAPEPEPEPEPEPQDPVRLAPGEGGLAPAARPTSSSSITLGFSNTQDLNFLVEAKMKGGEGRAGARQELRVAPPKPEGEPLLLKDLGRMRAIRRGHKKVETMERTQRALEVQQQALQVEFVESITAVDAELREVRSERLEEVSTMASRVSRLERTLDDRKSEQVAAAEAKARHLEESATLQMNLDSALESTKVAERIGAGEARSLTFQVEGLSKERDKLDSENKRLVTSESGAQHRAERAESEALHLREEMRKAFGELRKVRSMCQTLQARQKVGDELTIEMEKQRRTIEEQREAAAVEAEAAAARERDLLQKLDDTRKEGRHDKEVATVRQEEIGLLRDQLREKELVIRELAGVNARLEVQEARLETMLEERERILMNSAVTEVNRLKGALNEITGSRDKIRRELQKSIDELGSLRKQMSVQEDLVRKAAYTNVSYGKRLDDLTLGLQRKHADVTDAKRKMVAAMEREEEVRIQLARVEKEFEIHRDNSVAAQEHKVVAAKLTQSEKIVLNLQEECRLLRRQAAVDSGQYEGVIVRLDEKVASLKATLDEKLEEEEEALKHGGTASQKLKMEIDRLKTRVHELHGTIRSQEKRAVAAESRASELEEERKQMATMAKRATAERQYAMYAVVSSKLCALQN